MTLKRSAPMKRSAPLKRGAPLKAKTALRARTPLERSSVPLKRAPMVHRPRRRDTTALRTGLAKRSDGICEIQLPGCWGRAVDPCHRVGTKSGGRHGEAIERIDRLSNALHGCRYCHDWQKGKDNRRQAELNGWVLLEHEDPLTRTVKYRGRRARLDDAGGVTWV